MAARASGTIRLYRRKRSPGLAAAVGHHIRARQHGPDIVDLFFDITLSSLFMVDESDNPINLKTGLAGSLNGRQDRAVSVYEFIGSILRNCYSLVKSLSKTCLGFQTVCLRLLVVQLAKKSEREQLIEAPAHFSTSGCEAGRVPSTRAGGSRRSIRCRKTSKR